MINDGSNAPDAGDASNGRGRILPDKASLALTEIRRIKPAMSPKIKPPFLT